VEKHKKEDQIRISLTHWSSGFGENGRNCMKDLYYWLQTVDQLAISVTIGTELLGFVLEEVEDSIGRVAVLEGLGEGICGKVYPCLLGIVGQSGIENGLKAGRHGMSGCWWAREGDSSCLLSVIPYQWRFTAEIE
jgi:hypothetical protein